MRHRRLPLPPGIRDAQGARRVEPPTPPPGFRTKDQEWEQCIADQAYAEAAPLRAVDAKNTELRDEIAAQEAERSAYWDLDLSAQRPDKAVPDSFILGGYESSNGQPVANGPQVLEAFGKFLTERHIQVTNRQEGERLRRFMELNVAHGAAVTVENWWKSFTRLYDLSSKFRAGVTGYTAPVYEKPQPVAQPAAAPKPKKATDPIELWSTERRDELQMIYGIVNKDWQAEFIKWANAWSDSLQNNFNYIISDELLMKTAEFLQARNLSPFSYSSWDAARRHFVSVGMMPEHMKTEQERLNDLIDGSDLDNRDVRRMINLKQQEILEKSRRG